MRILGQIGVQRRAANASTLLNLEGVNDAQEALKKPDRLLGATGYADGGKEMVENIRRMGPREAAEHFTRRNGKEVRP